MLRKTLATAAFAGAIAFTSIAGQAAAASSPYLLRSQLTTTPSTVGASRAIGALQGQLRVAGKKSSFTWTLTFSHLSGTAVHAGIYFGRTAKPSRLAMLLCNKCSSGAKSYYRGSYVASPAFVRALVHGSAYIIVQTKKNPAGEIRGPIEAAAA